MRICDDLRQAVLQAAIQGKLTKQLPEDGNAADLLKQITAEKAKLIKEGKIKKEKPLPQIKREEVPFDVPGNWHWCRVGQIIISTEAGKSPNCKNEPRKNTEWGVIKTTAIQKNYFCANENKVLPVNFEVKGYQVIHNGDLLITRAGPRNRTGIVCIVKDEPINLILSDKTVRLNYSKNNVFPDYLMIALMSPFGKSDIEKYMVGMASSQVNISQDNMRLFLIPLPPLAEQQRIVARVEELMDRIDDLEKTETELEKLKTAFPGDMKAALLQAAMQGKLTEQQIVDEQVNFSLLKTKKHLKIEDELDIPDTWINVHLEDVTKSIATKQYQILDSQIKNEGKYPVISQSKQYLIGYSDIEDKVLKSNCKLVAFGDHTTVVKLIDFDFIVGADGVKLFEATEDIIPEYLYYCMLFNASKIADKGGYSRHYKFIKNIAISLPPLAEQKRIVEKLDKLLPLCDGLIEK